MEVLVMSNVEKFVNEKKTKSGKLHPKVSI